MMMNWRRGYRRQFCQTFTIINEFTAAHVNLAVHPNTETTQERPIVCQAALPTGGKAGAITQHHVSVLSELRPTQPPHPVNRLAKLHCRMSSSGLFVPLCFSFRW